MKTKFLYNIFVGLGVLLGMFLLPLTTSLPILLASLCLLYGVNQKKIL